MIRILLLDDHPVVRTGYRRLLDAEHDLRVVCEAATADEACDWLRREAIDVAVVDLNLKGASGIEAIRRMLLRRRELKVLVLSMHDDPGYVRQAVRSGALGYLTKNCEPDELLGGVRRVARGERVLAPDIARAVACAALDAEQTLERLTPREFEVLRMAARGDAAVCIAEQMHLSHKTVLNHLSAVRQKLGADNDFKLLRLAVRHGLVSLPAESGMG
ncbi:MAG: response regulator [Rhodocyclaceae bacterium]